MAHSAIESPRLSHTARSLATRSSAAGGATRKPARSPGASTFESEPT
jgi:hypothetical protein